MTDASLEIGRVFSGYNVCGAKCIGLSDFYLYAAVRLRQWVYLYFNHERL